MVVYQYRAPYHTIEQPRVVAPPAGARAGELVQGNTPFLVDLATRARCDASIAPRFPAGAAQMLGKARKDWHVDFLVSLNLTQEDINRLFPPAPVALSLLHAPAPAAHHVA